MIDAFRITVGQLNPTLGDLAGNRTRAIAAVDAAVAAGSDLLLLPEMYLTGYPIQDLALQPAFVRAAMASVRELTEETANSGVAVAVGAPLEVDGQVYNALYLLAEGMCRATIRKHRLPNWGVFDEKRTYAAGGMPGPVAVRGVRVGFAICEDLWQADVAETLVESGAEILLLANGSPYEQDKYDERIQAMVSRVIETDLPLVYANLVGGQDDQVFDGGSFVLNRGGHLAMQGPFFEEAILHTDWRREAGGWQCEAGERAVVGEREEQDYRGLVLGLQDFVRKNGFSEVILGLSGGVDSALVAALAVDALGPGQVHCVMLPSQITGAESRACAQEVVAALGCQHDEIHIGETVTTAAAATAADGIALENLQARVRGVLLMAIANTRGELLLATGNKSETAVGYATLYGDMCGGYAPLKDVYKTRVYALSRWRNAHHVEWMRGPAGIVVPETVLAREPTAELRPDQRDQDSLPPYDRLDSMLEILIEKNGSIEEAVAAGHAREEVVEIAELLCRSEFKRFQSAPGPKITRRAFWLDRRFPVTNRFRENPQEGRRSDETGKATDG